MAVKPPIEQDYREKYTLEQVEAALRAANGNQSKAAEMLGTNRSTINGYIKRYEYLRDVIAETKESNLDIAEDKLLERVKEGNIAAIIFFLKTQGKSRGYVEKQPDKQPEDENNKRLDFSKMSTEELERMANALRKPRIVSN